CEMPSARYVPSGREKGIHIISHVSVRERISHLRSKYIASPSGDISQQARQRDKLQFDRIHNKKTAPAGSFLFCKPEL
ncbi:MAG: hypothetical protein IJL25_01625, partial [Clostridia bacterium]|nr:hypothetical protein [Clostridia bacterium]